MRDLEWLHSTNQRSHSALGMVNKAYVHLLITYTNNTYGLISEVLRKDGYDLHLIGDKSQKPLAHAKTVKELKQYAEKFVRGELND